MDAFYASVEMRDNPQLRNVPLVVGGSPQSRGVVATCNYEARKFGIKSAMACSHAFRLCPQAIFVPPRFEVYKEVSQEIRKIFFEYTPLVEPLSLDEAFLDVTDSPIFAAKLAKEIQDKIFKTTGLTASAGVGPNKMIAKIASDVRKPKGLTVVVPEMVFSFMQDLPMRRIPFVGPVTEKRLAAHGIHFCKDVFKYNENFFLEEFGKHGPSLYFRAQGIDESEVETNSIRKSFGEETTFAKDLKHEEEFYQELAKLCLSLSSNLTKADTSGRTITLKIKYPNFTLHTRSLTIARATRDADEVFDVVKNLLHKTDWRKSGARLLGVSLSKLS